MRGFGVALISAAVLLGQANYYQSAVRHVQQGRFAEAIPLLNRILAAEPADLKARNLLGIALMSSGRQEAAIEHFRKALAIDPRFHPSLKNLAIAELALGRNKDAKASLERAIKLVPADPVVNFHLGRIYYTEQRYAAAAVHFERSQSGYPDRYQAGFNLVLARLKAGEPQAAIAAGEQLIAAGFLKAELYNLLSQAYAAGGRIQEAYNALRAATQLDPRDESNYLELMLLCLEHENWELSLEISEIGLRAIPKSVKLRLQRGAVFALKGQPEEAEAEFEKARQADPKLSLPVVTLALLRIEGGRYGEAIDLLRSRRASNPRDYLVNWILAEAIGKEGPAPGEPAEKEAVQALEDAVRANPKGAPARALLATFLVKRGDLRRAAGEFEAALKLDPDDAAAAYQLAQLYQKTGDAKRAEELFAKVAAARAEDPSKAEPRNLIKIIREVAH